MDIIQSTLYKQTLDDLYKASEHYSNAEYNEALPILLRNLPLLEKEYRLNPQIVAGNALLTRVYIKLHKFDEAMELLEKEIYTTILKVLYETVLLKKGLYKEILLRQAGSHETTLEKVYSHYTQIIANIYEDKYEEALNECSLICNTLDEVTINSWVLLRAITYNLDDQKNQLCQEAQEAIILITQKLSELIQKQWYSSRPLPTEWKELFIDHITLTYAPDFQDKENKEEKDYTVLFPQPVNFLFEWAMEIVLSHVDDIPETELSRTLGNSY